MKIKFNSTLGVATLQKATALAERIENMQEQLNALLNGKSQNGRVVSKSKRFSPAQRKAISDGLKTKWAERKLLANKTATPAA